MANISVPKQRMQAERDRLVKEINEKHRYITQIEVELSELVNRQREIEKAMSLPDDLLEAIRKA